MRAIPENSTDILYSAYPLTEMTEAGNALGVSNINVITTACLEPSRALFHSCVNNIQARLKNGPWDEEIQGHLIADRADLIYDLTRKEFEEALAASHAEMQRKYEMLKEFTQNFFAEEKHPWNADDFNGRWPAGDMEQFPFRWQRKAIETYRQVKENIAQGSYTPGWDAVEATHWWGKCNLEYKHYRDISRQLVNEKLDSGFPPEAFLSHKPAHERSTIIVTGGMGSGKSRFTRDYIGTLPYEKRQDIILHDADYMKPAFARSALRDGKITHYSGGEVHNESSNALYENTIKRSYYARSKKNAPDVIVNSTIAGSFEVQDGLEGGGKVSIRHISIDYADALRATEERAAAGGRRPEPDTVRWSVRLSPQSLLSLFEKYPDKPVTVHLFERSNSDPVAFGIMDVKAKTVTTDNPKALLRLASRAELAPQKKAAQAAYIAALQASGVSIECKDKNGDLLWTLSPQKTLSVVSASVAPQKVTAFFPDAVARVETGAVNYDTHASARSHSI